MIDMRIANVGALGLLETIVRLSTTTVLALGSLDHLGQNNTGGDCVGASTSTLLDYSIPAF